MEMPALSLMVLDGLDDIESVESLRGHGEVAPYGLALVDEQEVIDALRTLLLDGLVEAWEEGDGRLVRAPQPATDDASLRGYWFQWTAAGERVWRGGRELLDVYWDAHPPGG
jgi:hypothetical protein